MTKSLCVSFILFQLGYEFGNYGSCKGDSGGRLIRYDYVDGLDNARYVQVGIVQGGVGRCGSSDFPSIYVRLENQEVLDFIKEAAGNKTNNSSIY